jgi:hypothetical protein
VIIVRQLAHEAIVLEVLKPDEIELTVRPAPEDELEAFQNAAIPANRKRLMAGMVK